MEGQQLGSYRIERKLGEGGMGVVWVGVDVRLGRRAAIKQLLPELSGNREIVERFFNEAKAAASINHPGIVEIYDVGWHVDGSAFFAMKLLDGDSLARRLRERGPMPVMVAATISRQVASALAVAHARGIVHRDLKPDNIVLVADDEMSIGERATVLDFGIAKLFGDAPMSQKTRTGSVMGTPSYMSPEQCRGAGEVDVRTDVYALGCILFEMLTGRPPFVGEGGGEVLGMHQFVEAPTVRSLRPDVPAAFEAVVMRALSKRPDQRHQTMGELTAALQPFATARVSMEHAVQPPPSHAPTLVARPHEPSTLSSGRGEVAAAATSPMGRGSSRTLLAVGAGLVVVAAAVIAIVAASGGGSSDAGSSGAPATAADERAAEPAPQPAPEAADLATVLDATIEVVAPVDVGAVLAEATIALDAHRWLDARDAASRVLAAEPAHPRATAIRDDANAEISSSLVWKSFEQAAERKDYAAAVEHYGEIRATSVYKNRARATHDALHDQFIDEKKAEAQVLARAKKCNEIRVLAVEAARVFPDARDAVASVRCKADPAPRAGGTVAAGDLREGRMGKKDAPAGDEPAVGAPPGKSGEELVGEAKSAFQRGEFGRALTLAEAALRASPDANTRVNAVTVAAMSACNVKNRAKAVRYLDQLPVGRRNMVGQTCLRNGVPID